MTSLINPTDHLVLRIADLRVDPALDEICKDGIILKLEPRAMRLLLCLAEHSGRVVSVDQLLDQVWKDVVVSPDSVYAAVAALRRILGDNPKHPKYIANVVRRGYRLVAPVSAWTEPTAEPIADPADSQSQDLAISRHPPVEHQPAVEPRAGQSTPPGGGRPGDWSGRLRLRATIGLLTLAIAAIGLTTHSMLNSGQPPPAGAPTATNGVSDTSIAVLAFVDMSEKHDQEYFGDGLAEELIDQLTQLAELRVISRTSAFQFKAKSDDARVIGAKLSVANILEGSVRRSEGRLRVAVQLVDASDGSSRWSQIYERSANDVFKVQDEIAKDVVQALKPKLLGTLKQHQAPTENIAAHNLLLEGRFFQERWAPGDPERAIVAYEGAIREDPSYALAWAELSWATLWKTWYQGGETGVAVPAGNELARRAALKAIELGPDLALAHATRGWIESVLGLNWVVAEMEFSKALALEPQNMRAIWGKAMLARILGQNDESLRYYQAALERDPINAFAIQGLSTTLRAAGRTAEAVRYARRALDISPDIEEGHWYLGYALLWNGEIESALTEMRREPSEFLRLSGIALIEQARRDPRAADAALRELLASNDPRKSYYIGAVYAARGNTKAAVASLERSRVARNGLVAEASCDPAFQPIRRDPEFLAFLRRMKLPE